VNISRLQLALRGLAAQDAVIRVAGTLYAEVGCTRELYADCSYSVVNGTTENRSTASSIATRRPIGRGGTMGARLGEGKRGWQATHVAVRLKLHKCEYISSDYYVRYGDDGDVQPPSPLYKSVSVPSRVLHAHNLEFLVFTLGTHHIAPPVPSTADSSTDALLVPILPVASGRTSLVEYPVHKTLVVGEGLDGAMTYGKFIADGTTDVKEMVKVAIELPLLTEEPDAHSHSTCSPLNIEAGAAALAVFRESIANSTAYEHGWFKSGLPALSEWLVQGTSPAEIPKPALKKLVESVIDETERKIAAADATQHTHLAAAVLPSDITKSILGHLESWAEKSHAELRDELDEAFSTGNWHKLAWWKLLWRADDVGMITSEILERRWLVTAEKNCIYLAGRMDQAGFPDDVQKLSIPSTEEIAAVSQDIPPSTVSEQPEQVTKKAAMDLSTIVRNPGPWPSQIPANRTLLSLTTVPHLQSLSQRLVLTALSTTATSSVLSAFLYLSLPTFSVFEAGAIAALGLTYSLRRLQKLWEKARENWQAEVREEGRKTLKVTEDTVRLIVERSQKPVEEAEGVLERRRTRQGLEKVREALTRV
jgi:hypothetical protein